MVRMMANWPWPADSKDDRLRRIIDHYRSALAEVNLEACLAVDNRMVAYGQGWVCDNSVLNMEERMTARQLSERHGMSVWDVYNWERMGFYKGYKSGRRKLFRQGDVLVARSKLKMT